MVKYSSPFMLAGLALVFLLAGLFGGPAGSLDGALIREAARLRADSPGLVLFAQNLTNLGGATATLGLTAMASLRLLLRRNPFVALLLASTVIAERLLVDGLKDWIGRPRPPLDLLPIMPQSLAYPSGHAANSMTAFLAVALLVSPPAYRWAIGIAAMILSLIVGVTRIFLGVHWPSDVIGGWTLGLFAVGVALAIGERSGALEAQHDVVGRHRLPARENEAA